MITDAVGIISLIRRPSWTLLVVLFDCIVIILAAISISNIVASTEGQPPTMGPEQREWIRVDHAVFALTLVTM